MSSFTRYSLNTMESGSSGDVYARMLANSSGEWVRHADVHTTIEAQAQRIQELERELMKLRVVIDRWTSSTNAT